MTGQSLLLSFFLSMPSSLFCTKAFQGNVLSLRDQGLLRIAFPNQRTPPVRFAPSRSKGGSGHTKEEGGRVREYLKRRVKEGEQETLQMIAHEDALLFNQGERRLRRSAMCKKKSEAVLKPRQKRIEQKYAVSSLTIRADGNRRTFETPRACSRDPNPD